MEQTTPPLQPIRGQEASVGPLPAYDVFLRALGDSYLNFFLERLRLEEQYRDGMVRLFRQQRNVDQLFSERIPENEWSLRKAWRDICDGLEIESQSRGAFIESLKADIVIPLQDLKETHERSRKRIKEDNKSSLAQYNDYIENVLPRLKRTYLKRCQEVDEWKAAGETKFTPTVTSPVISNPILPKPGQPLPGRSSMDAGNGGGSGAGGNVERIRGRQSSIAVPGKRDRSPGGTMVNLSDLAHQGRRQLNNLRTLIETKGVVKEGGARTEAAMRGVRAKRDAVEADKEYRKGVHALETLRLRREKTLEAGYISLETLVIETTETMRKLITHYTDNLTATNATGRQLSTRLGDVTKKINPSQDLTRLRQITASTLTAAIPKRILYYSYQVGECYDMLFGVSLVDYASSRGLKDHELPKIVGLCIAEVEARGLKTEGIYRVSGKHTAVVELSLAAEKSEAEFQFDRSKADVFVVGALLKYYLRELPEPVFKVTSEERKHYTEDREKHIANNFSWIRGKIRRLPVIHQTTLRAMLEHLGKIAANSKQNKMDAKNLAVVFGPVLLGEEPATGSMDILMISKDILMEDLITYVGVLYNTPLTHAEEHDRSESPPLPSPPDDDDDDEPIARPNPIIYGSSHTVVKTLPASATDSQQPPKLPPRRGRTRRVTISNASDTNPPATQTVTGRSSEESRPLNFLTARLPPLSGGNKLKVDTDMRSLSANPSPLQTRSKSATPGHNASNSDVVFPTVAAPDTSHELTGTSTTLYAPTPTTAASATSTTGHDSSRLSRKNSSTYASSLLMEPAVLMSQAHESEASTAEGAKDAPPRSAVSLSIPPLSSIPTTSNIPITAAPIPPGGSVIRNAGESVEKDDDDEFEVDYPGSPDTSALEFKTAENTPITEALPLDALTHL